MKISDVRAVAVKGWWGLRDQLGVMAEASREKMAGNAGSTMHLLKEASHSGPLLLTDKSESQEYPWFPLPCFSP